MNKKILILLTTYNGARYIKQQIDSLLNQTYKNFEIIARDDGSSDNSFEILISYDIKILESMKNLGAKGSFGTLLEYAVQNSDSEYFMFCDQDDVWENDKIEKTFIKMLEMEKSNTITPLLVHTDLKVVDEKLVSTADSFWNYQNIDPKKDSLNRLLVQNTITGCTMMINRKLAELALPVPKECIMHDWWIGLVASAFGRIDVINDKTISYRQHSSNDTGAKKFGIKHIISKIKKYQELNTDKHLAQANSFLNCYRDRLDTETVLMLEDFINIKSKSFWRKRKILIKHNLLMQGFIRNIGLMLTI